MVFMMNFLPEGFLLVVRMEPIGRALASNSREASRLMVAQRFEIIELLLSRRIVLPAHVCIEAPFW